MLVSILSLVLLLSPQVNGASIEGQVVRSTNGEAVVRAAVLLSKIGGPLSDYRATVSDDKGAFAFRGMPAGRYRVYAQRDDYLNAEYGQAGASPTGEPITLKSNEALRGITVTMTPTGVITGRVSDNQGNPARDVWVYALRPRYIDGQRTLEPLQPVFKTDDLGEYRLFGLPPGSYFVSAAPPDPPRIENENYVVSHPQTPTGGYFRVIRPPTRTPAADALVAGILDPSALGADVDRQTFYPRTTDAKAALPVVVRPGETVGGVNLRIIREKVVNVRGRVLNGESVLLSLVDPASGGSVVTTRSTAGGAFLFSKVAPGSYEIRASSQGMRARVPILVGSQDLDSVSVPLQTFVTIEGRLRIEGRIEGEQPASIGVELDPGPRNALRSDKPTAIETLGAGEYLISLQIFQPQIYVKSLRLGATEVRNARLQIDRQPGPLEVVLAADGGKASGRVVDAARKPAPGSRVALVPEPSLRTRFDLYRSAIANNAGEWEIQGIAPGEYKVFAWERIDADAWQDPEVLRPYENQGVRLIVRPRDNNELTLRVIPSP